MKKILMMFITVFGTVSMQAQSDQDAIRPFYDEFGPGARAMAMGGAYAPIAEDFTATYWNPAGLAQIRKMEFYGSLSRHSVNNRIGYQGTMTENTNGFTNINALGLVFPIPTYRGSLVFAIGYNRVNHFDNFNQVNGAPVIEGKSFSQTEETTIDGSLNQWSFAGAVDLTPNFSLGGTLNLFTGKNDVNVLYNELDEEDIIFDVYSRDVNFAINPEYTGYNFKIGSLLRPIPNLRLALNITMPTVLHVEENSSYSELGMDDTLAEYTFSDDSFRKYKLTSPWRFEIGASYKYQLFTLSSSMEFVDWTETRFSSNILDENDNDIDGGINRNIITRYRSTNNFHLGGEAILPALGAKVMAGYYYNFSPYKNGVEAVSSNRQYLSGGVTFLLDKQVKVDFAYQHGWWKQSTTDDLLGVDQNGNYFATNEKIKTNRFLVSLSYRF